MKTCKICEIEKTASEFNSSKSTKDGLYTYCKECRGIKTRAWYLENKERILSERKASYDRDTERDKKLRSTYGISLEQYNQMLEEQNGVCAVCGDVSSDGKNLHVDHDHSCCSTNRSCGKCIRALLCNGCNQAEGFLRSDPNRALALAAYMLQNQTTKESEAIL